MAEETNHSGLDKDVVGGTTAVNTPVNLEKATEETPSRGSTDELELEKKKSAAEEQAEAKSNVEYPVGFRLFAIVIALILSIFLVALDMTVRQS